MVYPHSRGYNIQVRHLPPSLPHSSQPTNFTSNRSMVGALNKLPVAASGMIFFGDPVNIGSVSAVGTGFVAGLVYALAKQNQSEVDKARAPGDGMIPMHNRRA